MKIRKFAQKLQTSVDAWLTAPEADAAGRLGLFRILFSMFYLWHLSLYSAASLSGLPAVHRQRIFLIEYLPEHLPPEFFAILESILVASLIILAVGFRVRLATAVILFTGCVLEAFYTSIDPEFGAVFMVFYIPLFMLLNGRWGHTYSLDALLRQRAGGSSIEPSDSAWPYLLPARSVLVVLSALFFSAAVFKVMPGSTWWHPRFMANLVLQKNVDAAVLSLPLNPLAPLISETRIIYNALRYQVLLFEGLFFLALFNRKLRRFFLALSLIFHSVSALWLVVTFTPVLIVYGLFVDWQALRRQCWPRPITLLNTVPSHLLVCATVSLAVTAGVLWNLGDGLRTALNVGGLLDWRTIWYPVLPLSLAWCLVALIDLIRQITCVFSAHRAWPSGRLTN